jgi:hypothetical protein
VSCHTSVGLGEAETSEIAVRRRVSVAIGVIWRDRQLDVIKIMCGENRSLQDCEKVEV